MGFDRDAYATRIKSLRKKSGLTQEQLAEKINVTSTYIVKIENSQRTGSIEFSVELASCFAMIPSACTLCPATAASNGGSLERSSEG